GGLAVALAESAIAAEEPLGVDVEVEGDGSAAELLFGESQSRVVLSAAPGAVEALLEVLRRHGVPAARIGTVGEVGGRFRVAAGGGRVDAPEAELAEIYERAIPRRMEGSVEDVDSALHSEVALP